MLFGIRLALCGLFLSAVGCQVFGGGDETTDSDAAAGGSGGGGTGGNATSKSCTTEEEDALIPDESFTDACPTVLDGPRTAPARNAVYPGEPDSVRVSFDQGALATFEGVACRAASSGAKTSEFGSCRQYFVCGCCGFQLERSGSGAMIEAVPSFRGESCSPNFPEMTDYEVREPPASGAGGQAGTGGTSSRSACDSCLSTCRGLSGCCSGVGCICESDCQVTSCGPGFTLCCGPYGGCFCSNNCPY
jgi:hypothetical protein